MSSPPENIEDSDLSPARLATAVFGPDMDPAAEDSAAAPRFREPDCEGIGLEATQAPEGECSPCCKPELDVIFKGIGPELEVDRSPRKPDCDVKLFNVAPRLLCEPDRDGILDDSSSSDSDASQRIQGLPISSPNSVALNLRRQHFTPSWASFPT